MTKLVRGAAVLSIAMLATLAASVLDSAAWAAELAGATLPDTLSAGNKPLKLNGLGLRKKAMFKVYVGGLYLESPSKDAGTILASDEAKAIRMQGGAARTAIHLPTAIDNMDWSNPFLRTLASLPIAPGVEAHSIVAVKGDGPPEKGDDGVVKYTSAHIDGVASELIVRDRHSTQATPETIEEVRRILYAHLNEQ